MKVVVKSDKQAEDRYTSFMHDLDAMCIVDGYSSRETAFIADRCQFLVDQDVLQSFNVVQYADESCRIDAWGLKPAIDGSSNDSIVLIISDFFDQDSPAAITLTDFRAYCNKAKRFFQNALKDEFRLLHLPANSSAAQFADYIYKRRNEDQQVTIIGITNGSVVSKSNKLVIAENTTTTVTFRYDIWDFARFARIERSLGGRESVDIDLVNDYELPEGIKSLHVEAGSSEIDSYLFVLPGKVLYEMYEQWNERLLEQNPRTFLQFTGKINKGIRGTLTNNPDRFFSYNNGIAAVANRVDIDPVTGNINKIYNLQIVNGGQTTASIYNAYYRSMKDKKPISIDKVYVMVKLSVIGQQELADQIIPKISEYSNSQNKVASSAFSIRHPFHMKMEEFSRNIHAPANGDQQETFWYYERVQGQYKNAINIRHSSAEKKSFESQNPKSQMFKSVELAKYVMAFDMKPYQVCLGSQKCYALFSKEYLKTDDDGQGIVGPEINQDYFKEVCCKALIFKYIEKHAGRGLQFVLAPYTIAVLMKNLQEKGLSLNYTLIWNKQWDNEALFSLLMTYVDVVYKVLAESMPEGIQIFSEWGKKKECWDKYAQQIQLDLMPIIEYTVSQDEYLATVKEQKSNAVMIKGIEAQTYVVSKPASYWTSLMSWIHKGNMSITSKEDGILSYATKIPYKIPSDKQSEVIIRIEKKAVESGFSG